jgi:Xaa-Pro aminopeptidase
MWALYNWYCSDFTRTFWVWEKSWDSYEKFIKIYEIVKNAHNNAFKKSVENMIWWQIDYLTRKEIEDKWYEKYYTHGTWHWVGLDIHESPSINEKSEEKIKNWMVFTIEPWIYLEGKFWVRLEDIVFMEESKLKKYTKVKL